MTLAKTLAATALAAAMGAALAAPKAQPAPAPVAAPASAPAAAPAPTDPAQHAYMRLERILTLKPDQVPLWKAYLDARFAPPAPPFAKPAVDEQERLEGVARHAQERADALKRTAQARAKLWAALSPEQKYVLENFESAHPLPPTPHRGPAPHPVPPRHMGPHGGPHGGPHCPMMQP